MILERLSKNNSKWQSIAIGLCGNINDANDLVNDFYIRAHDLLEGKEKELKDSYFRVMIKNLFIEQRKRKPNFVDVEYLKEFEDDADSFELSDKEQSYIDRFNTRLTRDEQEMLVSNYDNSMRAVARMNNEEYYTTNRRLADIRVRCLREDYTEMYSNKRDNRRFNK